MLNTNRTCKLFQINAKNHAKTSLPGNYHVNKWGLHMVSFPLRIINMIPQVMKLSSSNSPFKTSKKMSISKNYLILYLNKWSSEEVTPINFLPRVFPLSSDAALEVKRILPFPQFYLEKILIFQMIPSLW